MKHAFLENVTGNTPMAKYVAYDLKRRYASAAAANIQSSPSHAYTHTRTHTPTSQDFGIEISASNRLAIPVFEQDLAMEATIAPLANDFFVIPILEDLEGEGVTDEEEEEEEEEESEDTFDIIRNSLDVCDNWLKTGSSVTTAAVA
ncbi:hypothetical protein ScalyP_jg6759 [Parmales sp. scaly parma]|nr:hypothetical protein ScalyP_jg6759 [Parmales sp. scaly parma]